MVKEIDTNKLGEAFYQISATSFDQGSPWSKEQFISFFNQEHHIHVIAERDNEIAGFLLLSFCYEDSEIELIATSSEYQRSGVGQELMLKGLELLKENEVTRLLLEVRESNEKAQLFYKKIGFKELGRRKKYYHKPQEDALIWHLDL
ncbi:ribosomal protein S18-alanine N-acetyltransferase [Vagococcus fluvialis]|uniref:ribosomal protein S18-alanine N-acetyltransferase n=1 Tax=Vagococcus fluvialis TaxID=2738 RepID=UPI003B5BD0F2